jgi:hypothetical protein
MAATRESLLARLFFETRGRDQKIEAGVAAKEAQSQLQ